MFVSNLSSVLIHHLLLLITFITSQRHFAFSLCSEKLLEVFFLINID